MPRAKTQPDPKRTRGRALSSGCLTAKAGEERPIPLLSRQLCTAGLAKDSLTLTVRRLPAAAYSLLNHAGHAVPGQPRMRGLQPFQPSAAAFSAAFLDLWFLQANASTEMTAIRMNAQLMGRVKKIL